MKSHLQVGKGVGRFQGRDDALQLGDALECVQCLLVGSGVVLGPAPVLQRAVLGANARVVQPASSQAVSGYSDSQSPYGT